MRTIRYQPMGAVGLTLIGAMAMPAAAQDDPFADLPDTLQLEGTIRDFQEPGEVGGHPDFEKRPDAGFGVYFGIVANTLGEDGKPVFQSTGHQKLSNWRDAQGRSIIAPKPYIESMQGDSAGSMADHQGGAVTGAQEFEQWFRDVPGVNVSMPLTLTLVRQPGTNIYTFDDKEDPEYQSLGGFFPINDKLYGNSAGENKNFHFTYELATSFVYKNGASLRFSFTGDDDVWVYVDGHLVIDLGGVHSAESQTIDLDRLGWLVDGEEYQLKFFFAERHRTQSNFRIDTSLQLRSVEPQISTALHD